MGINGYFLGLSVIFFICGWSIANFEIEDGKSARDEAIGVCLFWLLAVICMGSAFGGA